LTHHDPLKLQGNGKSLAYSDAIGAGMTSKKKERAVFASATPAPGFDF
jgi:hypothetical protein